jgi:hypothetical protein
MSGIEIRYSKKAKYYIACDGCTPCELLHRDREAEKNRTPKPGF